MTRAVIEGKGSKHIYLIGFMGAGKTSVGRRLAKSLDAGFIDLDGLIEEEFAMTISQVFSEHGEDFFRDAETRVLASLSQNSAQVVATGGGVVLRDENWTIMKEGGITVYLRAPIEVIWSRIKHDAKRPLLQVTDPLKRADELLRKRAWLYERADLIIDTEGLSPQDVARELTTRIKNI